MSGRNRNKNPRIESDDQYVDDVPNLFKAALSATADGVIITDKNGVIKWANPAYEKLTGYSVGEVINKNPKILKSGKQDPAFYKELWGTITAGKVWKGELWNKRKDGVIYLEEQSITPVKDEQGNVTHFISIKRDITQQHELYNQLHMARRIEAIDQLTAGIAHNFNNKLASILGFADLAAEELKEHANEELSDCINEIIIAGKVARDLVRQMMAFSQNELSKPKPVNIELVVRQAFKMISSTVPKEVKVLMNLEELSLVTLDPIRLHQMLMSLAVNASEAMDGHGELTISTKAIKIDHKSCSSCHKNFNGDYISVSVRDTGKGITTDNLDNIFMPFFTTRQHKGGTGMGLSALQGMLHDMHGHVLVDSVPGRYTEFNLLFPEREKTLKYVVDGSEAKSQIDSNNENLHILVVDDEVSVANFLSQYLRLHGYHVTCETNSKEALKNISEDPKKYDLLITDQNMPQLSGTELVKLIYNIRPDLPMMLMTAFTSDEFCYDVEHVKAVLTKPLDTQELMHKIKQL